MNATSYFQFPPFELEKKMDFSLKWEKFWITVWGAQYENCQDRNIFYNQIPLYIEQLFLLFVEATQIKVVRYHMIY
jgi:hypothetical protein